VLLRFVRLAWPLSPLACAPPGMMWCLDIAAGADTQIIGSVANPGVIQNAFDRGVEAVIHAASLHKPISRAIPRRPLSM
jgi:hypothetical protein